MPNFKLLLYLILLLLYNPHKCCKFVQNLVLQICPKFATYFLVYHSLKICTIELPSFNYGNLCTRVYAALGICQREISTKWFLRIRSMGSESAIASVLSLLGNTWRVGAKTDGAYYCNRDLLDQNLLPAICSRASETFTFQQDGALTLWVYCTMISSVKHLKKDTLKEWHHFNYRIIKWATQLYHVQLWKWWSL